LNVSAAEPQAPESPVVNWSTVSSSNDVSEHRSEPATTRRDATVLIAAVTVISAVLVLSVLVVSSFHKLETFIGNWKFR
jgi:hypothetical protein